MFFDVLQVFVFLLSVYKCRIFDKPVVSDSFRSLAGIPLPVALMAQKEVGYYAVCSVCIIPGIAGERIRGNFLMITICPVLHTGQRQGLTPVSLAKRSTLVSGGFCIAITASIPGFSFGTSCNSRFRLVVWL